MLPAQQGFEAGDGAILQPHDGLEQHPHFVAIESLAQIALHREMVAPVRPHGRAEYLDAVAALALGMRHGDLGVAEHSSRRAAICGSCRDRPMDAVRKISRSA